MDGGSVFHRSIHVKRRYLVSVQVCWHIVHLNCSIVLSCLTPACSPLMAENQWNARWSPHFGHGRLTFGTSVSALLITWMGSDSSRFISLSSPSFLVAWLVVPHFEHMYCCPESLIRELHTSQNLIHSPYVKCMVTPFILCGWWGAYLLFVGSLCVISLLRS